jgi:selenocysteine lyase/cysteine desulfurase
VRLLALTAACNVTGQLLPIAEAIDLAHEYGALVLIDGAQTTGWWDLDLVDLNVDLFAFAGHKAPHAPLGIGGLFVSPQVSMSCPHAACERADSRSSMQRSPMPGYCDAGSVNLSALAGMAAAVNWLKESEQIDRLQRARQLAREFAESIREWPGLSLHGDVPFEKKLPTVAVSIEDKSSADIAEKLRHKGLITSGGFQCAPQAHYSLGTDRSGVVRFSFGPKNQATDVARAVRLLNTVMR